MRRILSGLVCLLVLATSGQAGSASEPEIRDPSADGTTAGQPGCPAGATACAGPAQVIDITAAWIQEHEDHLLFALQTLGSEAQKAYGPMDFDAVFTVAGTEFTAGIHLGQSSTVGGDNSVTPRGIAATASIGTDQYEFTVNRADLGSPVAGDVLDGFYMTSVLNNAGAGVTSRDRAPNSGGVSYTFTLGGATSAAPEVTYQNVTGELAHRFAGDGADAAFVINYTGPSNVTLHLKVEGNGTVNFTVLDPTGGGQYDCLCTDGTNLTMDFVSEPGIWQVQVRYEAFTGNATIILGETAMASSPPPDTGNETEEPGDDGATKAKDTPGPGVVPVIAVVAGLMVLRARRSGRQA